MISLFDKSKNIVGKGENASCQHFLLYPQCFPKPSSLGVVKSQDCVVKNILTFSKLLGVKVKQMMNMGHIILIP